MENQINQHPWLETLPTFFRALSKDFKAIKEAKKK